MRNATGMTKAPSKTARYLHWKEKGPRHGQAEKGERLMGIRDGRMSRRELAVEGVETMARESRAQRPAADSPIITAGRTKKTR